MGDYDLNTQSLFANVVEASPVVKQISPAEARSLAMAGSPADRAEFTRAVSVAVDSYRKSSEQIRKLIERARRTSCPGGLWIIGQGGMGKTFVLEAIHQNYPPIETPILRTCPVLLIKFSARPSVSDILLSLLLEMGQSPAFLRGLSNAELEEAALDAMRICKVCVILFDEAHHLWLTTGKNSRSGGTVGDFLKRFYDSSGVAFIFAGTEVLTQAYEKDPQLNTRWIGRIDLQGFKNDLKFRGVLAALDAALPMTSPASLASEPLASSLYRACDGNFRKLKMLLSEAVYLASAENAPSLNKHYLKQAYLDLSAEEETPFDG
ncbi:TniB family NTP-binding protein [Acidovorax sp.]|uniref:TniB family NTP-binding protein n=1 Tax=Acidovorax sp. TaxID=1872122 RepID=UPI0025B8D174|nr:TniB family NTP-binding protein [Acidovorax sp.]